ncbi:MAG TPA: hypothetical protein VFW34_00080 [Candidatus Rubrimentiphilum sp.]|nr:hypothetical protein [Candidatus Rubrimentiphilum sp.]
MIDRYRTVLALTSLCLLAAAPAAHHRHARHSRHPNLAPPAAAAIEIYSRRALRRARIILQLKLMELREEQLDRVRRAVERRINASPHP